MKLSTKSRIAVSAMLNLALHDSKGPATLGYLSENQNVSVSYLEQLFSRLPDFRSGSCAHVHSATY